MYSQTVYNELLAEQSYTPPSGYAQDITRLSFQTRRELKEAARVLNPADPFSTVITQHTSVVANAITRAINNQR